MRAQRPDHVAVTGDLVNIGMPSEFHRAALWMETFGDPSEVSFVPGNHDAYVRAAMPLLETTFAPWTTGDKPRSASIFPYLRVRGEVAIIGLSSGVPTGPLMATGKLGRAQLKAFAELLAETGAKGLARVVLIHHPPLVEGAPPLRGLSDAVEFEAIVRDRGAEAILHGHTHSRLSARCRPARRTRTMAQFRSSARPRPPPPRATRAFAPPIISYGSTARASAGGSKPAPEALRRKAGRSANGKR